MIIYSLDLAGTFAFALSGAYTAAEKGYDIIGIIVVGFVTAMGGGIIRDLLMNAYPITWLADNTYFWLVVLAAAMIFVLSKWMLKMKNTLFAIDSVGLAVFTLLGVQKALDHHLNPIEAVIMGMMSGVFGGLCRDVITRKTPFIFTEELYASVCIVGGGIYMVLLKLGVHELSRDILVILVVLLIRVLAVRYHITLPKVKGVIEQPGV
jgi:uncharacterized membrane protein YeiH